MLDLLHLALGLALTAQRISAAPLHPRQDTPTDTLEDVTLEDAELANVTVENPTYSPSGLLTGGLLINGTIINATIANASDDNSGLTVSSNNTVNATAPAPSSSTVSLPISLPTSSSYASTGLTPFHVQFLCFYRPDGLVQQHGKCNRAGNVDFDRLAPDQPLHAQLLCVFGLMFNDHDHG
ncbi:hypothetical protein D0860_06152 [Hortaea werneckii]|uniref:Uncharacterized protein n=1 Tax=Hortaea werneckii TaxID=91943 RepID=A0A3M7GV52_HORWE|nr:hypothetical protein D0860_06152 [Hortaea werneckii]